MAGEVSRFVRMYRLGSSRGHEPVREQRRSPYSRLALGATEAQGRAPARAATPGAPGAGNAATGLP